MGCDDRLERDCRIRYNEERILVSLWSETPVFSLKTWTVFSGMYTVGDVRREDRSLNGVYRGGGNSVELVESQEVYRDN